MRQARKPGRSVGHRVARVLGGIALLAALAAEAAFDATVDLCFNYGCSVELPVLFREVELAGVRQRLAQAVDAESERAAIAEALALLYRVAGGQTPIFADRAGNLRDAGVQGRMDCIDHSTSTSRLLELLEARGWLKFHRVVEPARRTRLILQHFSAVIEESDTQVSALDDEPGMDHVGYLLMLCDCPEVLDDLDRNVDVEAAPGARFAVDSWFVDHGEPAVILPLADWLKGEGPNVQ
jgi:hypothetical protein